MGLIIHLGGSVNAKKIVVVVTVVRLGRSDRGTGNLIVGVVDGSGNFSKKLEGAAPSPAMQIKYGQRWAASFLDWFYRVSQLKV